MLKKLLFLIFFAILFTFSESQQVNWQAQIKVTNDPSIQVCISQQIFNILNHILFSFSFNEKFIDRKLLIIIVF
jgi:hypothetical protein